MGSCSTTDHTSALWKDPHLYTAFIHLTVATDAVDHGTLWTILKSLRVPGRLSPLCARTMRAVCV